MVDDERLCAEGRARLNFGHKKNSPSLARESKSAEKGGKVYREDNDDAERRGKQLEEKILELCCGHTYQAVSIALPRLSYHRSSAALDENWEKELSPRAKP